MPLGAKYVCAMRIINQMIWSNLLFLFLSMPYCVLSSIPNKSGVNINGNLSISFESSVGGNTTYESCSEAFFIVHRNGVLAGQDLYFKNVNDEIYALKIIGSDGQVVWRKEKVEVSEGLDISHLEVGFYHVMFTDKGLVKSVSFMKQ